MNFLKAEWKKLAIINYEIEPRLLLKYVPKGTELDFYKNRCYVSLVGFMFTNTRLFGLFIPLHRNFEEINLRFYVKRKEKGTIKRGVVFIKEIVPKPLLSFVANSCYKENYHTVPMKSFIFEKENELQVKYSWKDKIWNSIQITAGATARPMEKGSEFEFITEHYFGFTKNKDRTSEYQVCHPKWREYLVKNYQLKIDFYTTYGKDFAYLNNKSPISIMLAEGSEVEVKTKRYID